MTMVSSEKNEIIAGYWLLSTLSCTSIGRVLKVAVPLPDVPSLNVGWVKVLVAVAVGLLMFIVGVRHFKIFPPQDFPPNQTNDRLPYDALRTSIRTLLADPANSGASEELLQRFS